MIAFTSERDGNSEIYRMNADGSDPQRLTNDLAYDAWPSDLDMRREAATGPLCVGRGAASTIKPSARRVAIEGSGIRTTATG